MVALFLLVNSLFLVADLAEEILLEGYLLVDIFFDLCNLVEFCLIFFYTLLNYLAIWAELKHFLLYEVLFVFILVRLLFKDEVLVF